MSSTASKPNQLIHETSPYLLQHAHNPVEWYPWGKEALQKAIDEDKPILVSIGYAACHWCHVMERESFEDEVTAALMNQLYINIKIDREERPDLDHIYMEAVQAIAGNGGWPLNVFLTPHQKPFYGGTYFPPVPAHGRASWKDVLISLADAWKNKRDEIEEQAESLVNHVKNSGKLATKIKVEGDEESIFYKKETCEIIAGKLLELADKKEGGFGAAPKFLQTGSIIYLLQHAHFCSSEAAQQQAVLSLKKMVSGGIYDQVGGGISRYSTDNEWLVPHFEKMLYDNALLMSALAEALLFTGDDFYQKAINKTFEFLLREMKDKDGGFYAALDADSEGVEGLFYIWSKEEIERLLTDDAEFFCTHYQVKSNGNMPVEHKAWKNQNILHSVLNSDSAKELDKEETRLLDRCNKILLRAREQRVRPQTDNKIILGWNALLITAFCKSFAATTDQKYLEEAMALFEFIESSFHQDRFLYGHAVTNAQLKNPAYLEDLAYYIQACIHLLEATADVRYKEKALELCEYVLGHFTDDENIMFFFTNIQQEDIIIRKSEIFDGATPSANGIMAENLFYLGLLDANEDYTSRAELMLKQVSGAFKNYPGSFGNWARIYQLQAAGINEIVVDAPDVYTTITKILQKYFPNKILTAVDNTNKLNFKAEKKQTNEPRIYVCRNKSCKAPVSSISQLLLLPPDFFVQ